MSDATGPERAGLLRMAADVASAYVKRHQVQAADVSALVTSVHAALTGLATGTAPAPQGALTPAVPVKKSVGEDFIVCLEDGKRLKMLKRYLRTHFNLSPEQYRAKWGLPADYPMVAPNYAKQRSDFAKSIGLGKGANMGKRGRKPSARKTA
jgi:predicted transcriptional regulator